MSELPERSDPALAPKVIVAVTFGMTANRSTAPTPFGSSAGSVTASRSPTQRRASEPTCEPPPDDVQLSVPKDRVSVPDGLLNPPSGPVVFIPMS